MDQFGSLLRYFRQNSKESEFPERRLSQQRLGELIGQELGDRGVSGASISDWERGQNRIHSSDRLVLISLIKVLHQQNGIKTPEEANRLLEAGNYRALNTVEKRLIFPETALDSIIKTPEPKLNDDQKIISFLLKRVFLIPEDELPILLATVAEGPPPVWPRLVIALFQISLRKLTTSRILNALLWLLLWLFGQALITPSLFWPFTNEENADWAITLYSGGALILPLLIAALVNTRNDNFWQERALSDSPVTRLYTYQGAFIGFHLGYFLIFPLNLIFYYLNFDIMEFGRFILVAIPLTFGYLAAHKVPRNLWNTYGRLSLYDGAIFFVFLILGPIWGWFLRQYYSLLFANPQLLILMFVLPVLIVLVELLVAAKSNFDKPKDENHQI